MKMRVLFLLSVASVAWTQGRGGPVNRDAPVTDVPRYSGSPEVGT